MLRQIYNEQIPCIQMYTLSHYDDQPQDLNQSVIIYSPNYSVTIPLMD